MKNLLRSFLFFALVGCITPATQANKDVSYEVACATAIGTEMIRGRFSQIEILDGGTFALVSLTGRRVFVKGFCLAVEMRSEP